MWNRLYRNHVIMAFPTYDTVANAWAPQADINWFAGSSRDSKFVQFSKRCTTEEEAVTWALRRGEVWVDNRLRRLSRAILPERGRGIDMIEAAKSHLGKVTPEQPVRARSATEPGPEKTLTFYQFKCAFVGSGLKLSDEILQKSYAALIKPRNHDHWSWLETRRKLEHTWQDLTAAVSSRRPPRVAHIPLRQRPWRRIS
jgi:hypothetical protein